jgi:hypothetical protein
MAQNVLRELKASDSRRTTRATMDSEAPLAASAGIDLAAEEGSWFIGHQLDAFTVSDDGVIEASKPSWISLYRTEGRDFTLTGEVRLGGQDSTMLFPDDLPDGFALFLREWDGVQRYQLDSRRIVAKRRMLQGRRFQDIEVLEGFSEPQEQEWISFRVSASRDGVEYVFGSYSGHIEGPLDTNGANKIAIAPGTQLRNLRLSVRRPPDVPGPVAERVSPEPGRIAERPDAPGGTREGVGVLSGKGALVNGGFEELARDNARGDEAGAFGETMFSAGSQALRNWSVLNGPITWRDDCPSPAGGRVIELGPRNNPGCVAQTFTTEPNAEYEVSFYACTGRDFAHYNRELRVKAGDLDATLDCRMGSEYARVTRRFRAVAPTTTLTLCGVGAAGFGPMVDDVQVRRVSSP